MTAAPGTTRDLVTESIALEGIPVELIDTAGLRAGRRWGSLDEAEVLGIARSRQAMADADVVLLVIDGTVAPIGRIWRFWRGTEAAGGRGAVAGGGEQERPV